MKVALPDAPAWALATVQYLAKTAHGAHLIFCDEAHLRSHSTHLMSYQLHVPNKTAMNTIRPGCTEFAAMVTPANFPTPQPSSPVAEENLPVPRHQGCIKLLTRRHVTTTKRKVKVKWRRPCQTGSRWAHLSHPQLQPCARHALVHTSAFVLRNTHANSLTAATRRRTATHSSSLRKTPAYHAPLRPPAASGAAASGS